MILSLYFNKKKSLREALNNAQAKLQKVKDSM
jgi:hypothetical protein